jgi:hypothetical protein
MAYPSMASMMNGNAAVAPVPTQTFNGANILGTPIPQVGTPTGATSNYAGSVGTAQTSPVQIVIVAVALIVLGYVVYHINFEK